MAEDLNVKDFVTEAGWEDDSVRSNDIDFYKGETDIVHRIGVVTEKPKRVKVHFKKGSGYAICRSRPAQKDASGRVVKEPETAICCKRLGEPRWRCASVVVQYRTDKTGKPKSPPDFEVKAWLFGEDKYQMIKTCHENFSLAENDLLVACSDATYQKLNISTAKGVLWKHPDLKWEKDIREKAKVIEDKLPKLMGKLYDDAELAEYVGSPAAAGEAPNTVGESTNLDDLLGKL